MGDVRRMAQSEVVDDVSDERGTRDPEGGSGQDFEIVPVKSGNSIANVSCLWGEAGVVMRESRKLEGWKLRSEEE